jgi:hypothetical protein
MAVQKAIKIMKDNYSALEAQYEMDEDMLESCVGMNLIAHFGSSPAGISGLLSDEGLDRLFTKTGVQLENGYFEVRRK